MSVVGHKEPSYPCVRPAGLPSIADTAVRATARNQAPLFRLTRIRQRWTRAGRGDSGATNETPRCCAAITTPGTALRRQRSVLCPPPSGEGVQLCLPGRPECCECESDPMERSFKTEVEALRLGDGAVFRGEGILAVTKALLPSGVSYVGGYQGTPVSHLLDVLVDADDILAELGMHVGTFTTEASAAAIL